MTRLRELSEAIIKGDRAKAEELTRAAIEARTTPDQIITEGLIAGMQVVGEKFRTNEFYVPEVLIAARAMHASLNLLKPLVAREAVHPVGRVVIGTVRGDLHDIGKSIVAMMLEGAGFEVVDLGVDVAPEKFVEAVRANQVDMVAMSALLTTTMPAMKATIAALDSAGLRTRVKVMVGGAPVTQEYADEIGADGYGSDATSAVDIARRLLGVDQKAVPLQVHTEFTEERVTRPEAPTDVPAAVVLGDDSAVSRLALEADELFRRGNYNRATRAYDQALTFASDSGVSAELQYRKAQTLLWSRRWRRALGAFEKSVSIAPSRAGAWSSGALCLANLGRLDEAASWSEKAIELDPGCAASRISRGEVLASLGRYEDAINEFDAALASEPQNAEAWFGKGRALILRGDDPRDEAEQCLQEACARDARLTREKDALLSGGKGVARASLIFGILGLVSAGLCSLVGVVLGVVGLRRSRLRGKPLAGRRLALWGVATSTATLVIMPALLAPVFLRARESARKAECMSNLKQLALAVLMYANDYDERLPLAKNWSDGIYPYVKNRAVFSCPDTPKLKSGYAYNRSLEGMNPSELANADSTVVLFESDKGWNAAGGGELLPTQPRHLGDDVLAFADGHVAARSRASVRELQWSAER